MLLASEKPSDLVDKLLFKLFRFESEVEAGRGYDMVVIDFLFVVVVFTFPIS